MNHTKGIKHAFPYIGVVIVLHILGVVFLLVGGAQHPLIVGMGIVAYTLGLRHAFDADHIAAIDNTVRKLLEQHKNPMGVGFYFSLGHSSVVFLMAVVLGLAVHWAQNHLERFQETGGLIGTIVSGVFLLLIGVLNLVILIQLVRLFRQLRHSKVTDAQMNDLIESRGLIMRLVRPLFRFIQKSWHIFPLGFLFGLGFDTASEVSLLALSAGAAQHTVPFLGIIALPILFAAGMSLLDTLDGVLMTNAYHWAFDKPARKIFYNITMTAISVVAAIVIGGVEIIQLLGETWHWDSGILGWITQLDFSWLGYALVFVLILSWVIALIVWKAGRFEEKMS
ncbi:HoxN/HupN/NixA family nickel/cobalt transporter [Staphylococcus lutrae]|uniref:Nickel/cobalt efflux system n=1 Tax=Staphylococcus lutrae TaxID=155085 RepID=A0AAC9RTZ6_9STAP|nr:HoxN/HupN/NixA family nickel/cobalt transporter [Staphylococcus lutrae]ARJ50695.1 nickel permease [Staphylococcus lutrae]PNZ34743.1 HoxN/HupN/NixA family nickel/cobalt transporter [Staphylococcus lutrae]